MVNGSLARIELPKEMDKPWLLTAVTQDRSGGMWVAFGRTGLYRLKDGVWTKYGGRSDFPSSGAVIVFADTLGRIWFGCAKTLVNREGPTSVLPYVLAVQTGFSR